MNTKMQSVNPVRIELARKSRGLTQTELAEKINVSQSAVSKIEQGVMPVAPEYIEAISKVLQYPKSFFLKSGLMFSPDFKYHRSRSSLPMRVRERVDAENNIRALVLKELLDAVEIANSDIPELPLEEFGDPEDVARALRTYWRLPRGPIKNLTNVIENAGGVIIHADLRTRKFDGVYYPFPDLPPMIFLNKDIPGDRLRFTLAHELGHIVMHQRPKRVDEMDRECDRFAAAFLMPEEDIKHQLFNVTLPKVASLKPQWKVSMAALLVRARNLGTVSARHYRTLWTKMGAAGYRKREPYELDVPMEEPTLRRRIVDVHLGELEYTVEQLAHATDLNEEDFRNEYLNNRNLRLVKIAI